MTKKLNFNNELEREIKAAEKFLSLTNEDILYKSNNKNEPIKNESEQQFPNKEMKIKNDSKENSNINTNFLFKYYKQLRDSGYPEPGNIQNCLDEEKCKFINFFDYILSKKNYENELRQKYKTQIDSLNEQLSSSYKNNSKLEKDLSDILSKNKQMLKENKESESKITKLK